MNNGRVVFLLEGRGQLAQGLLQASQRRPPEGNWPAHARRGNERHLLFGLPSAGDDGLNGQAFVNQLALPNGVAGLVGAQGPLHTPDAAVFGPIQVFGQLNRPHFVGEGRHWACSSVNLPTSSRYC